MWKKPRDKFLMKSLRKIYCCVTARLLPSYTSSNFPATWLISVPSVLSATWPTTSHLPPQPSPYISFQPSTKHGVCSCLSWVSPHSTPNLSRLFLLQTFSPIVLPLWDFVELSSASLSFFICYNCSPYIRTEPVVIPQILPTNGEWYIMSLKLGLSKSLNPIFLYMTYYTRKR